jgi:hypothetical protein
MKVKSISAGALSAAAIGILTATAVPALGHGPGVDESGASTTLACPMAGDGLGSNDGDDGPMGRDAMGSMMGMMGSHASGSTMGTMGPDEVNEALRPVDGDGAADPVDHQAHHPAAIREPTE